MKLSTPAVRSFLVSGMVLVAFAPPVFSQSTASRPPSVAEPGDDAVELSAFVVDTSKDKGYRATNSISGTRLNTPIKEVPMPIEVITEDFIRDVGANNMREALGYSAGVLLESQNDVGANDFNARGGNSGVTGVQGSLTESAIKLRGFTTTEQLRSGFKRAQTTDSVSIGRLEVVRGPAALLYGTGNFGGIVNVIPKRPTEQPYLRLSAQAGSYDSYRGEIDASTPLGAGDSWLSRHRAGVRVMGSWSELGDWTDFNTTRKANAAVILTLHPFANTRLNLEWEQGFNHRDGIGFQRIYDNYTLDANDYYRPPTLPSPRQASYRWSGPDTYRKNFNWNGLAEVEQRIGDRLTLVAGANFSNSEFYHRLLSVTGLPANEGPPELRTSYNGANNLSLRTAWNRGNNELVRTQTRVELNYRFEAWGSANNVLIGRTDGRYDQLARLFNASNNYRRLDDYSYFRYVDSAQTFTFNSDQTNYSWDQGSYLVYQGKFWDGRITTVSGVRYDRADTLRVTRNAAGATTASQRRPNNEPTGATTPQIGLTYKINRALSVYLLRSGGLNPNYYDRDGAGVTFDPVRARSNEAGIKFDLIQGKLSGTVSVFRVDRENTTRNLTWVPAPYKNSTSNPFDPSKPISYAINVSAARGHDTAFSWLAGQAGRIFMLYPFESVNGSNPTVDRARLEEFFNSRWGGDGGSGLHNNAGNNASKNRGAFVAVDDRSEGADFQLVYTPTDRWSITASYAYLDRYITRGARSFVSVPGETQWDIWYWKAKRENFGKVGDVSTYNGSYADGMRLDDTPYNQVSVWNRYSFREGRLRNVSIGGGARWLGPREYRTSGEGSGSGSIDRPYNTVEEYTIDALVGYRARIGGRLWNIQLNVSNLLDDQSLIGDLYKAPRSWRLTTDLTF